MPYGYLCAKCSSALFQGPPQCLLEGNGLSLACCSLSLTICLALYLELFLHIVYFSFSALDLFCLFGAVCANAADMWWALRTYRSSSISSFSACASWDKLARAWFRCCSSATSRSSSTQRSRSSSRLLSSLGCQGKDTEGGCPLAPCPGSTLSPPPTSRLTTPEILLLELF